MDFKKYRKLPAPKRAEERYGFLHRVGVGFRRALPFLLLALSLCLMASVISSLRSSYWCYYTDDIGVRREAEDPHVRFVLWSIPEQAMGNWRRAGAAQGVKFHPDDGRVFVSMQGLATNLPVAVVATNAASSVVATNGTNFVAVATNGVDREAESEEEPPERIDSDLFESEWNGKRWSEPVPMDAFNSPSNEYELVESRDGRWRLITTDRPGGAGGADIWIAAWNGRSWGTVTNFQGVNSAGNERGLAMSPDGTALYFASDRAADANSGTKSKGGFDIYCAKLELPQRMGASFEDPPPPIVVSVEDVSVLNTVADDFQPELTPRGDMLYFASSRKDGLGGYDIYAARIVRGELQDPENLGVEINSAADDLAPAVRMEGFDLMFRSNKRQGDRSAFPLYSATCREVVTTVDLTRLENYLGILNKLKWWVLTFVLALAALIYLVKRYRDLTDRFHKCLMASIIVHLVALLIIATFTIAKEVVEAVKEPETVEIMIDPQTLKALKSKKESLAIDKNEEVAKISSSAVMAQMQDKGGAPLADAQPTTDTEGPTIAAKSSDKTLVAMTTPSAANPLQGENMAKLKKMDDVKLTTVDDVVFDEPPTAAGQGVAGGSAGGATEGGARDSDKLVKAAAVQRTVSSEFAKRNDVAVQPMTETVTVDQVIPDNAPGFKVAMAKTVIASASKDAAPGAVNVQAVASLKGVVTPLDIGVDGIVMDVPTELPGAPGGTGSGDAGGSTGGVARAGTAEAAGFNPGMGQYNPASGFSRAFAAARTRHTDGGAGVADVVGYGGANVGSGVPLRDTGGKMLVASAGGDRAHLHRMEGAGAILGKTKGGKGSGDLKFEMPDQLDVPAGYMERNPADLVHWVGRPSVEVIEALGGSEATEGSISNSLVWLSKNQEEDGRWDCKKHGGEDGHDVAATSLALLCYFGWGMKHNEPCLYQTQVKKALDWMLKVGKENGDMRGGNGRNGMYDQGMAGIALCEAYGVTKDPALFEAASNAVKFIVNAQSKSGGWVYAPAGGGHGMDLSVFGWSFMALNSAKLAGIPFDESALVKASNALDFVTGATNAGFYGYNGPPGPEGGSISMMAVGMFCRQLQKFPPGHDRMKETANWLRKRPLGAGGFDAYYLYYTTLALYQHQGEIWEEWNKKMKEVVPPLQVQIGDHAGSWNPGGQFGGQMGRVVMTAMTTLSLEVYYRYLPMYGYQEKK